MNCIRKSLATSCLSLLVVFFLITGFAGLAWAGAYEAKLPAELSSNPDLCSMLPCQEVYPGAQSFSVRKGQPPYVEAYADKQRQQLLGYLMLSTDITDTPAYSGKPVVSLIALDRHGKFVGIKVLKHSEPILLLGIPESALIKFNQQYIGKSVSDKIEVGQSRAEDGVLGVDAISGATVTVIAQNQVIMSSATAVARQLGLIAADVRQAARFVSQGKRYSWAELVAAGAVQKLSVKTEQLGLPRSNQPFIELWFGDLNHPDIGKSLLGENAWDSLRSRLGEGEQAIFVIRSAGDESFKGSGFVRGGIYDRIQVKQGADTYTFRDLDYLNLYGLEAAGAPAYNESAIFILRDKNFSAAYPWKLNFLGNKVDRATGARSFANFPAEYWLAEAFLQGGRPEIAQQTAAWKNIWRSKAFSIAGFAMVLLSALVVYSQRDRWTRQASHKNKWPVNRFKYSFWLLAIIWFGAVLMAQPSITQVLTWFHSLLFQWTWSLFLSDPFIFIFWIFIILSVFLYGRGFFCGWLCPFGSLSEALFKLARVAGLKRWQFSLPLVWHTRLKWLKYGVFIGLLSVSMVSMALAEILAEIEPFKTTFLVGIQHRSWPYGLFVACLLGLSLFMERPYCKYLCPLGAALAMPSSFRWFGLRRKQDCNHCKACAKGCGSQAIDQDGRIDQRECLLCLDCMVLYTDQHACPPLAKEAKRRQNQGLAQSEIARNGYFIPIYPETSEQAQITAVARTGPDPGMLTNPLLPAHLLERQGWAYCWAELLEHCWPWRSAVSWRWWHSLGLLFAALTSASWLVAIHGSISSSAVIAWWLVWSVYEVLLRKHFKPWVKEGVWWGKRWREASWFDLVCYVSFKNLIIGAALFLGLQAGGWL